jgi:hypothetical protein
MNAENEYLRQEVGNVLATARLIEELVSKETRRKAI